MTIDTSINLETESTFPNEQKDANVISPLDDLTVQEDGDETAHDAAMTVPMTIQVIVGQAQMTVGQIINIRRGSVVELDRKAGDVVDIAVNGKTLAKGELTVFEDGRIGVTLVEIVRGTA